MSQNERNAPNNRVGELLTDENVVSNYARRGADLLKRVMEFLQDNPRATAAAAQEAERLGLSGVLKRVLVKGTQKTYVWRVRFYRGG